MGPQEAVQGLLHLRQCSGRIARSFHQFAQPGRVQQPAVVTAQDRTAAHAGMNQFAGHTQVVQHLQVGLPVPPGGVLITESQPRQVRLGRHVRGAHETLLGVGSTQTEPLDESRRAQFLGFSDPEPGPLHFAEFPVSHALALPVQRRLRRRVPPGHRGEVAGVLARRQRLLGLLPGIGVAAGQLGRGPVALQQVLQLQRGLPVRPLQRTGGEHLAGDALDHVARRLHRPLRHDPDVRLLGGDQRQQLVADVAPEGVLGIQGRSSGKDQLRAPLAERLRGRLTGLRQQIRPEPQVTGAAGRHDELLDRAQGKCEDIPQETPLEGEKNPGRSSGKR